MLDYLHENTSFSPQLKEQVREALAKTEQIMEAKFADPVNPY